MWCSSCSERGLLAGAATTVPFFLCIFLMHHHPEWLFNKPSSLGTHVWSRALCNVWCDVVVGQCSVSTYSSSRVGNKPWKTHRYLNYLTLPSSWPSPDWLSAGDAQPLMGVCCCCSISPSADGGLELIPRISLLTSWFLDVTVQRLLYYILVTGGCRHHHLDSSNTEMILVLLDWGLNWGFWYYFQLVSTIAILES